MTAFANEPRWIDDDDVLRMRIDGIGAAAGRARVAFFIMLFACGAILCTLYNNYWTWNRIIMAPNRGLSEVPTKDVRRFGADTAQTVRDTSRRGREADSLRLLREKDRKRLREIKDDQMVREMADYGDITISWLGIKFSSADADILATLGLFLVSMYSVLCVRRLSLDTIAILRDTTDEADALRATRGDRAVRDRHRAVYFGVRQSYVLDSSPFSDRESTADENEPHDFGVRFLRWLFPALTLLPAVTTACCLASDLYYIFVQEGSRFRDSWWWALHLDSEFFAQLIVMEVFTVIIGVVILRLNVTTYRLDTRAAAAMKAFVQQRGHGAIWVGDART